MTHAIKWCSLDFVQVPDATLELTFTNSVGLCFWAQWVTIFEPKNANSKSAKTMVKKG